MNDSDDWQKVEANPTWDYKEDKELVGTYVTKEEQVGPNSSNLYSIIKADSSLIGVWGNKVLDDKFKGITLGDEVKLIYLGMITSEKTGREFHSFEVYRKPPVSKD